MHADELGVREEFLLLDRNDSWPVIFQQIRTEAAAQDGSIKDSRRPEYRNRNRYRDVNPYDHSRVRIEGRGIDYINASLVESPQANRSYILTQGPLPDTAGHFWLMVWEQNSKAVLMLNKIIEKDQIKEIERYSVPMSLTDLLKLVAVLCYYFNTPSGIKCYQYYPVGLEHGGEDEMMFDDVGLKIIYKENKSSCYHYTARLLVIHNIETREEKEVLQFHYTAWPDFGVPESPAAFLDFLFAVRDSGSLEAEVGPAVIHCSAGIGRSGTFCLVDTCLVMIEQSGNMSDVKVRDVLLDMRTYRMGLIQTPDQLRFSYLSIVEGAGLVVPHLKSQSVISSHTSHRDEDDDLRNGRSRGDVGGVVRVERGVAEGIHPSHQARLRRAIPHACSTEESSEQLWSENNANQSDYSSDEPLIMPGEEQCITTHSRRDCEGLKQLKRRLIGDRKKKSESERERMRESQEEYGLTHRLSSSRRNKRTKYQTVGALVAIIGAYLIYRLCGG